LNVIRSGLVCLLMAGLVWGQTDKTNSTVSAQGPPSQVTPVSPNDSAPPATLPGQNLAAVSPDTPVITIAGLCDYASTGKFTDASCKNVVTRAEFEVLARLVRPKDPPQFATDIARMYIDIAVKSQKALQMGLDKKSTYPQRIEVLRLLFYAKTLDRKFEDDEWAKITPKDIDDYYRNNLPQFEIANVSCIFVPKFPPDEQPGETLTDAEKQARQRAWDQSLKEEAEKLHRRALAGEDFVALQREAYTFTGVTNVVGPTDVTLKNVRRKMFDQNQPAVMDLKVGEISPPLYDDGYYIYRMDSRSMLPLEKVRGEIHKQFQVEGVKRDKDAIQREATITYNDVYLGPPSEDDSDKSASGAGQPPNPSQAEASH